MSKTTVAIAHPNIALSKYWGKRSYGHNLPAVPSLSVTLSGLCTRTEVSFDAALETDELILNGSAAGETELGRVAAMLTRLRALAGTKLHARVVSKNDFPTASGLASSASAFAALAVAASSALGLDLTEPVLSDLARQTSVSAARSVLGGFAALRAGQEGDHTLAATQVAGKDHWDLAVVVAVTREGPKDVGSSMGMKHTADTSPYFNAWVDASPSIFETIQTALLARDFKRLGPAVEQSALAMHAAALAAKPATIYFSGATMEAIAAVRRMRDAGLEGYLTIDAGPHVKVLTRRGDSERVAAFMEKTPGVLRTITAVPGDGARVIEAF